MLQAFKLVLGKIIGVLFTMAIQAIFRLWGKDSGLALGGGKQEVSKVQKSAKLQAPQPAEISQRAILDKVREYKAANAHAEKCLAPKVSRYPSQINRDRG